MGWGSVLGSVAGGVLGSVVPGIGTGIGASVGGMLGGAIDGSNAADDALDAQREATNQSNATQRYFYDTTRQDNMPLLDLRNALLPRIQGMAMQDVGVTPSQVMAEPGYQFGLSEGLKGVQNTAAGRNLLYSGATLKALNRYGTDYATTKFNDAFNRQQTQFGNQFNRLTGAAGMGQAGVNQISSAGQNYANTVSNNQTAYGNAAGANALGKSNVWADATNQLISLGNQNGWWKKG